MTRVHRALVTAAATMAVAAALVDARPAIDASTLAGEISTDRDHISAPELAERIMRGDPALRLFDVRPRAEYEALHIPTASHATLDELSRARFPRDATVVVYSEGSAHAAQAWVLLRLNGVRTVYFLREGIYEWIARVREPRLASSMKLTKSEDREFYREVHFETLLWSHSSVRESVCLRRKVAGSTPAGPTIVISFFDKTYLSVKPANKFCCYF